MIQELQELISGDPNSSASVGAKYKGKTSNKTRKQEELEEAGLDVEYLTQAFADKKETKVSHRSHVPAIGLIFGRNFSLK